MAAPREYEHQIINDDHAVPHKSEELEKEKSASWFVRNFIVFKRSAENYQMHAFWITLYTLVLFSIFAERAYCEFLRVFSNRVTLE